MNLKYKFFILFNHYDVMFTWFLEIKEREKKETDDDNRNKEEAIKRNEKCWKWE